MSFPSPRGAQQIIPALPRPGELVEGRYLVQSELGRGGMGVVLAAHDEMLGRDVALKLLLPEMMSSSEVFERFCNEARSLARLESRHVVKVLDFSLISQPEACAGLPVMVLELLRGQDLFSYAQEHGTLPPGRVVRLALQACDGLAAAHAAGIVHRDLKPENLFIAIEPDGSEVLKVLDFGVARGRGARVLTGNQVGIGSPGYMAPEQVEGSSQVDARCDIWALGIVMYELLAQQPAFSGETPHSLCLQILTAPITPLSQLRPELPAALVYVVERCLERDPDRRFANVAELAEALAPLDDWSPDSEATRVRRRLDAVSPVEGVVVRPTPAAAPRVTPRRQLPSVDDGRATPVSASSVRSSRARRRRVVSGVLVTLALVPAVALLPAVSTAPELGLARAWSAEARGSVQRAWLEAHKSWHAYWSRPAAPEQPAPAP